MSRREHYSAALTQSQGIFAESLSLFEIWEDGMSSEQLFDRVQSTNALSVDSERRLRNIVIEGFCSRYLRSPYLDAAPTLKLIFGNCRDKMFLKQLNFLYTIRQHGILFGFLTDEYWPAIRHGGQTLANEDVMHLIDRGLVKGLLSKNWEPSVRKRVSSYVLGVATDFDLLGGRSTSRGRPILHWAIHDLLVLYLAYDLHFLGFTDDEVANAEEWNALGLRREDVTIYLSRLQNQKHLNAQDTGHLCRIDWSYKTREEVANVIIS